MAFNVKDVDTNEWKAHNMQLLISWQYILSCTIYKLLLINVPIFAVDRGMPNAHI